MGKLHSFKSFRERVNDLKINPYTKLEIRSYDHATNSFFLSSLNHWKEINISGNFVSCIDQVEPISQSLPQVIHHKDKIFCILEQHISKHDIHSLQPLLEMLTQFIHDLGPDFLPFYKRFVKIVIEVCGSVTPNHSQSMKNSAFILEWCFNSLAFAFRYLSLELTGDLWTTFESFETLFKERKKAYIGRFCAEAMSYLIRKLPQESFSAFVDTFFNYMAESDFHEEFLDSMVSLFAEAMKLAKENVHSKSMMILKTLIAKLIPGHRSNPTYLQVVAKVIMDLLHHASRPNGCDLSQRMFSEFHSRILIANSVETLHHLLFLVLAIVFVDNGGKLRWESDSVTFLKAVGDFYSAVTKSQKLETEAQLLLSLLLNLVVRNLDVTIGAALLKHLWDVIANDTEVLRVSILELLGDLPNEKYQALGIGRLLQQTINGLDLTAGLQRLSLLILREAGCHNGQLNLLSIPSSLMNQLLIGVIEDANDPRKELTDVAWRCEIFKLGTVSNGYDHTKAFEAAVAVYLRWNDESAADLLGCLINMFIKTCSSFSNHDDGKSFSDIVRQTIRFCGRSVTYVNSLHSFLCYASEKAPDIAQDIRTTCVENLSSPQRSLRLASVIVLREALPNDDAILQQITVIDQVPLHVGNAYDVKMRIKSLFKSFSEMKHSLSSRQVMSHYAIGLLCNKFQPCWEAVFDALRCSLDKALDSYVSSLLFQMAFRPLKTHEFAFEGDENVKEDCVAHLLTRQDCIFKTYSKRVANSVPSSRKQLMTWVKDAWMTEQEKVAVDAQMRSRMVRCLEEVPRLVEGNGTLVLDLIFEVFSEKHQGWRVDDKIAILKLVSLTKSAKNSDGEARLMLLLYSILSSGLPKLQEAALKAILSLDSSCVRYRDNLSNLLDDKLFKDEILNLLGENSENRIPDEDQDSIIPLILHILFGKVQTTSRKSQKSSTKFTVATVLPNLETRFIQAFLSHMSGRIPWKKFYEDDSHFDAYFNNIKVMSGYIHMLTEVYDSLGYKYGDILGQTLRPLVFVLVSIQALVEKHSEDSTSNLKYLRQSAFKCLSTFDKLVSNDFEWGEVLDILFRFVLHPRMKNFAVENTEQTSSLLEFILNRVNCSGFVGFYGLDDWLPLRSVLTLFESEHCKEDVLVNLLDFFITAFTRRCDADLQYYQFLALIVDGLLSSLPRYLQGSKSREILSRCATLLLLMVEGQYLNRESDKRLFVAASCSALQKSSYFIRLEDKVSILISLSLMVETFELDYDVFNDLIRSCARTLRFSKEKNMRRGVSNLLDAIALKEKALKVSSSIIRLLNANMSQNSESFDFDKVLDGFECLSESYFESCSVDVWLLTVSNCLFFMDNEEENILRLSACSAIKNLVTYVSRALAQHIVAAFGGCFDDLINPAIRHGLANPNDEVRNGYIELLGFMVLFNQLLPKLSDLQTLLSNEESENFFLNVQHLQVTSRQRAIRGLIEKRSVLSASSVENYLVPILENYIFCKEEKFRNLSDDSQKAFGALSCVLAWNAYKRYVKKYISMCSTKTELTRDAVKVTVQLIQNLYSHYSSASQVEKRLLSGSPELSTVVSEYIISSVVHPIKKILAFRDDSTIITRLPLLEACVSALLITLETVILGELPGVLINTCQVLRSKSQELRDGSRKALCKASEHLGPKFLKYIIRELQAALSRGSQIHVLSYTLNAILKEVSPSAEIGDFDDSSTSIVGIIMEDIFGAAGKDKDAEGYHSKMKEVKAKKSFETIELLCSKLSLNEFDCILGPIKSLLKQSLPMKTEKALDEFLRRVCQGILINEKATTTEVLVLCYGIHKSSLLDSEERSVSRVFKKEDAHFLVDLKTRTETVNVDRAQYTYHLQRIAFDILKAVLGRNPQLLTVENTDGFIPLMAESLKSSHEPLLGALLRVAILIVKLNYEADRDDFFECMVNKAIENVLESPSTRSELCQLSLKYIAMALRQGKGRSCTDDAVRALIVKLTPDLEDPEQQSLAFNFMRAVISKRIYLAEVYDVMDKVLRIMVVNHFQEIRDIARGLYFKFMLLYDQGEKRLEMAFKFMVDNLTYPTASGRQSVMELIHSILLRSSVTVVDKTASSFFIGLANVAVSDDLGKCREMSIALIKELFDKASLSKVRVFERLIETWLANSTKGILRRCGLITYKAYLTHFGVGNNKRLDLSASELTRTYLLSSQLSSNESGEWEDVYLALELLRQVFTCVGRPPWNDSSEFWEAVSECLLFPHTWVRLLSSRLVKIYIMLVKSEKRSNTELLQNIAYRSLRQLAASGMTEALSETAVENIETIFTYFMDYNVSYIAHESHVREVPGITYNLAEDMVLSRSVSLLRKCLSPQFDPINRKAAMTLVARITSLLSGERLHQFTQQVITSLTGAQDSLLEGDLMFEEYSKYFFQTAEEKLGTGPYSKMVSVARAEVSVRRAKRRADKAQLMIDNPQKASERKSKKHARSREKRKDNKDANGYYKAKKRRVV